MNGKVFLDTNLWVYLHSGDEKGQLVRSLVDLRFLEPRRCFEWVMVTAVGFA